MEASELRIGNYIRNGQVHQVFEIGVKGITTGKVYSYSEFNAYYPKVISSESLQNGKYAIPLTEDWLLKFGFELREARGCNVFKFGILHLLHSDSLSYGCSFDPENNDSWFTEIKYLHQLQNLYFALTGEELAIK